MCQNCFDICLFLFFVIHDECLFQTKPRNHIIREVKLSYHTTVELSINRDQFSIQL